MAAAPTAELLELQALGRLLLVLRRDVIPPLAFRARQRDVVSHDELVLYAACMEPMTGIEPVTSSLPRTCSAN
jgi:hypothetical protein